MAEQTATVITEEIMPKTYKRQIALLPEIRQIQKDCPHSLYITKECVFCVECGGVWFK